MNEKKEMKKKIEMEGKKEIKKKKEIKGDDIQELEYQFQKILEKQDWIDKWEAREVLILLLQMRNILDEILDVIKNEISGIVEYVGDKRKNPEDTINKLNEFFKEEKELLDYLSERIDEDFALKLKNKIEYAIFNLTYKFRALRIEEETFYQIGYSNIKEDEFKIKRFKLILYTITIMDKLIHKYIQQMNRFHKNRKRKEIKR
jgi:hypothetical protein